jgi:hypothetical protein
VKKNSLKLKSEEGGIMTTSELQKDSTIDEAFKKETVHKTPSPRDHQIIQFYPQESTNKLYTMYSSRKQIRMVLS